MHVTAESSNKALSFWKNIEQKFFSLFKRILYFFLKNRFK